MAKQTKPARPRRGLGKQPQNFRLTPETIRKLDVAARQYGASKAVYVEMALKAQFKKDGV
jgi:predicted DNA-binding protein